MAFDAQLSMWRHELREQIRALAHYGQLRRVRLAAHESFTGVVAQTLTRTVLAASDGIVAEARTQGLVLHSVGIATAERSATHRAQALGAVLAEHVANTAKARVMNVT